MGVSRQPDFLQKYEVIGQGSFGKVYKGFDCRSGTEVAIKVIDLELDNAGIEEIRTEVSVLCHCDSPYIIRYYESYLIGSKLWIIMDYCGLGSLRQIIDAAGPIPEDVFPFIAKEVLKALAYLHDNRIIHRDVKAANILVTDDGHLKLGDFGVASPMKHRGRRGTVAGSPYWMAPEVLNQKGYDSKADIWSFGIAMIEVLTGNPPFHNVQSSKVIELLSNGQQLPRLEGKFSKSTMEFVAQCLQADPTKRPSAFDMLKSKFFRGVKTHVTKSPLLPIAKRYRAAKDSRDAETCTLDGTIRAESIRQSQWDFDALSQTPNPPSFL